MLTDTKNMSYANFNITFGKDDTPMLEYFIDVIFPAMTSGYKRSDRDGKTYYFFNEVKIIEIDNEYYLVGNFIKSTTYEVNTVVRNGNLVSDHNEVPTAPYSRFIVFLKNHRMIFIKNESSSPDIRSFQSILRQTLFNYIRIKNKQIEDKDKIIPVALVNVISMPISSELTDAFKNIKKITELRFKFCPLNADIGFSQLAENIKTDMKDLGSKNTYLSFTSPNIDKAQDMIKRSAGAAEFRVKAKDNEGNTQTIQTDKLINNQKISMTGDISHNNDKYLVSLAMKNDIMKQVSDENKKLYEKIKDKIAKLLQ